MSCVSWKVGIWGALVFGMAAASVPLWAQTAGAIVNVTLTPPAGDSSTPPGTLAANDDGSTDAEPLGIGGANGINFFGNNYTQVYVNNNGNLTFTGSLSQFTPNGLAMGVQCDNSTGSNCPIIAPFFADVDTTGTGSGLVMYGNATVQGFNAFVANYINVGYFASETDKLNSFQVILLDRSDTGPGNFDIEFNYGNILWETGDASDGTDGLGGTSAAVGYSNGGMGANNIYFQLTGSLVNGALINGGPNALTTHSVNSSVPGRYIFPVRQGAITLLISNITCTPGILGQGGASTCTITLTGNAPSGGAVVALASNNAALSVPASVSVPAGQNTVTFTAGAGNTASSQQATVTATLGSISQTAIVTVSPAVQTGYIGVFYNSTPPSPCPASQTVLCNANTAANNQESGVFDAPVFVFVNTSGTPITGAAISVSDPTAGTDSFKIGTIGANASVTVIPGVSRDGQSHPAGGFFAFTGEPFDTSDDYPSLNSTQFKFTGQQGSTQIQSVDVCGAIAAPTFTPACTVQPLANDAGSSNINFLGGPGDNDGGCNNCFGPAVVALLNTAVGGSGGGSPVTITTTMLSNDTVSTSASQTLSASGGTGPYTWSLAGGTIPTGLTLSSSGVLSGTPSKPGSYTFSVKVTDANGNSAVQTITLTVAPQSVTITTPSPLTSGMVTVQYPTQVLSAAGGFPPYTFSLASGATLPGGLTLSSGGAISGIPTSAGTSQVGITATDAAGQSGTTTLTIPIRPFSPDLLISSGSLSFKLAASSTTLPLSQDVPVEATDPTKILNWSAVINPSVSWLALTGGGTGSTTPGAFQVALTSGASQLAASATPYSATVVVSCLAPSPCAGNTQNVTVKLLVSTVSPELTVLTNLLSFSTPASSPQTSTQTVAVQNTGGGTVTVTQVSCAQSFCVPGTVPGPLGGGATGNINITANPAGLSPGFYFSELTIVSSAGTAIVPVTLLIQSNPSLVLSPSGVELNQPAGGMAAQPDKSFLVNVSGAASTGTAVPFTAQVLPGAPWLTLNTMSGSATPATPGTVMYTINSNSASLAAGAYYATIRVTSSGAINSPQDFEIVMNVEAAAAPQVPNPTPAGLIFSGQATSAIPAQKTTVYASTLSAVPYQASASTASGGSWLSVSPATGTTSAASAAVVNVTANPSGLAAGIYHGTVSYSLAAAAVPAVNVTLIVEPASGSFRTPGQPAPQATGSCTPSKVVPTQTALVTNFSNAAAWPTPLEVQVSDDCGNLVTNGQVVTTFSNGDPPLILIPENSTTGYYAGTWTPRNTGAQITVTAAASAPGLAPASVQISGSIVPNAAPVINPGGTVHAFTSISGESLAPGTWMAIYGTNLANQLDVNMQSVFPTSLAGTSVIIGGEQTPLEFVSTGQVNALIPFDLMAGQNYQVIVNNNGALSTPAALQTGSIAPGVAAYVSGFAEAQHGGDYSLITASSPARPGEYIIIYLLGMGATTQTVISGQPSPTNALTIDQPTVTLNGENVTNLPYSGLTPTAVGLYQINLQVPADAPNGDLPLIVMEGGVTTPSVILPVHN